ncbi:MAG: A/G-specific adenine glycosylase, partial [Cytophagaceae bacterium]
MHQLSLLLLTWYKSNKRPLPWREESDPYHIWLSEILLQQTRVAQGLPYYLRFIEAYPNLNSLAKADEKEVLHLWQGLGYYSRARNMLSTAKSLTQNLNGKFPGSYKDLLKLKGVGSYTAAAIASFAYNEKVPVVDGNVIRVLSRVYGIEGDIRTSGVQGEVKKYAEEIIPDECPSEFNQAIMEFGALHCTPALPKCDSCPITHLCFAFTHKKQKQIPFKSKAKPRKERYFNYLVMESPKGVWMNIRKEGDIWTGMYD